MNKSLLMKEILMAMVSDVSLYKELNVYEMKLEAKHFDTGLEKKILKIVQLCSDRDLDVLTPDIAEREGINKTEFMQYMKDAEGKMLKANFKSNILELKASYYNLETKKMLTEMIKVVKEVESDRSGIYTQSILVSEKIKNMAIKLSELSLEEAAQWKHAEDVTKRDYRYQEGGAIIPTGIKEIDVIAEGIYRKNVTVIDGFSGHGKTTILLQMIANMISQKKKVLFFSIEMTAVDIIAKLAALLNEENKTFNYYKKSALTKETEGKKTDEILTIINDYIKEYLAIVDESDLSLPVLMATLRKANQSGFDVIALDYLQKMNMKDFNIETPIIANTVTRYIKTTNMAFVFLSQLTEKEGADPLKAKIRFCTELYNACSLELRIFKKTPQAIKEKGKIIEPTEDEYLAAEGERHVAFMKNRFNQGVKPIPLAFEGSTGKFGSFRAVKIDDFDDLFTGGDALSISMDDSRELTKESRRRFSYGDIRTFDELGDKVKETFIANTNTDPLGDPFLAIEDI